MGLILNIWSKIKTYALALLGAITAILYIMYRVTLGQKRKAQEDAQEAQKQVENAKAHIKAKVTADEASQKAKIEGDVHVQEAVDNARAGNRDHFSK